MFLHKAFRKEIFLPFPDSSLEIENGVYSIAEGWTILDGAGEGAFGRTHRDRLSIATALRLGVLTLKEPRSRLANDETLGLVGHSGDVIRWDHDGLALIGSSGGTARQG